MVISQMTIYIILKKKDRDNTTKQTEILTFSFGFLHSVKIWFQFLIIASWQIRKTEHIWQWQEDR